MHKNRSYNARNFKFIKKVSTTSSGSRSNCKFIWSGVIIGGAFWTLLSTTSSLWNSVRLFVFFNKIVQKRFKYVDEIWQNRYNLDKISEKIVKKILQVFLGKTHIGIASDIEVGALLTAKILTRAKNVERRHIARHIVLLFSGVLVSTLRFIPIFYSNLGT